MWFDFFSQNAVNDVMHFKSKKRKQDNNSAIINPKILLNDQMIFWAGANIDKNIMPNIISPNPSSWKVSAIIWKKVFNGLIKY